MADIRTEDLDRLRNCVGFGVDIPRKNWGFRNRYIAGEGALDSMRRLVEAGWMREAKSSVGLCGRLFHATADGCRAVGFGPRETARAMEGMPLVVEAIR